MDEKDGPDTQIYSVHRRMHMQPCNCKHRSLGQLVHGAVLSGEDLISRDHIDAGAPYILT